jgi:hypothetical protein
MEEMLDYTKKYKDLYLPGREPAVVDVPRMPFIIIEGTGDPNGEEFGQVVEALYGFSYTIKMSYKSKDVPEGYYPYKVFPLEGIWDLVDITKMPTDKSNFKYSMMIRQPDFVTPAFFEKTKDQLKKKKTNPFLDKAVFREAAEGLCCQMMHIGSYNDEPASFDKMADYCGKNGFLRISKTHREIYISDPRRTDAARLRTVLRFQVKKGG